ncbi:unnamed protein product [Bursaphelenchus okinawaensis]|uniref:Groucho/TLE N-terminal Q-rich domain-containing protein n=1 Tax=Bursaphelenchus okinawaensis TaxID=465554 RepID=A0A811KQR1_9BILA|nr:unnamed protein product [Bursaphelenchus okinawaensis]CAG9109298.1 unnamed protein product [Bursaphelenchus okinawaensis]
MVRGPTYDPEVVRRRIHQHTTINMGSFFEYLEHLKKEFQQLQTQNNKLKSDNEKKAQELNMFQKQAQEAALQSGNLQVEVARQSEINRRLQQVIQQYALHLTQEQQLNLGRHMESAMKVSTQDIIQLQQQQQLMQAMSSMSNVPPQLMAMMSMDMKPNDLMAQFAAMQQFSPANLMQAQAAMAQMAQMNMLGNPAAAQLMAAAGSIPPSSMAALQQQSGQQKLPMISTPISTHAQLPTTPMSSATIAAHNGAASPFQRAASSRSGSTSGTPLPKRPKMEEPQSRPTSNSAKSDKSDEGGLVIDVQNEDQQQQQNGFMNQNAMIPPTNGINGTVAAV